MLSKYPTFSAFGMSKKARAQTIEEDFGIPKIVFKGVREGKGFLQVMIPFECLDFSTLDFVWKNGRASTKTDDDEHPYTKETCLQPQCMGERPQTNLLRSDTSRWTTNAHIGG